MTLLPPEQYALVERSIPLACVDFIPVRDNAPSGPLELGLILRESPFGQVWCHLGGRIRRGESIRGALLRHAAETLRTSLDLPEDPQPDDVFQWFPPTDTPYDAPEHGEDPRKHAIGLSFLVKMIGDPVPQNEALDFGYFPLDALPVPLWPGTLALARRMLRNTGQLRRGTAQ